MRSCGFLVAVGAGACEGKHCSEIGETRPCSEDDMPWVERCVEGSGSRPVWGTCAPDLCEPGEDVKCTHSEFTTTCVVDNDGVASPADTFDDCDTPLVLAFDARDPLFTAPQSAAAFDISGADACTTPDWPTAATPWLARDLDRSGSIDGGHELFGNGTLLPSGDHARHGFAALASVDSNLDGAITPADLAWPELLLWSDHDSDRRSTGWELLPLHAHGVASINLDYYLAPVCDARGNCSRERASFTLNHNSSQAHGEVIDVYLRCE
ncbi:MAG: calcium-binding protein [Nannocystis sp.]|uniref:calcium-binding protein n=1 Tax=Nannocystis sp. TaxID=1962667 RepID=UPI00242140AF|nr:calcium-binding protein [Nannocystis sp.]MBK9753722.1 calcium-binding protein [Nannocystis sp.]